MPSSYTPLLRLTLPADGELVGTWGQTVNNGITSLEEAAIAGTATIGLADADFVLSVANGAPDSARNAVIRLTGALTAQRNVVCPSSSKTYIVRNDTTGGFGINFKTAAGVGVVVPAGGSMLLYCNGVDVLQAVTVSGAISVTDINGTPDLILKSSGTEKMRILANGNVGIGTAAPANYGAGVTTLSVAGANGAVVDFKKGADTIGLIHSVDAGLFSIDTLLAGTSIALRTLGVERMRINAAGNVGIGNSLIASETRLLVSGADSSRKILTWTDGIHNTGFLGIDTSGAIISADGYLAFSTSGTANERMRIDADGNVGVATNVGGLVGRMRVQEDPTNFIGYQVFSPRNIGNKQTTLISGLSQNASQESVSIRYDHDSAINLSGSLSFWTTAQPGNIPTERMRINASGNAGIGTSASGNLSGGNSRFSLAGSGNVADCALLIINVGDSWGSGIQSACRFDAPSGWHFRAYGNTSVFSGGIQQVNATTIAFPTTSDARRKKNIVDAPDQGAVIDALVVREFEFSCEPDVKRIGFIAQEVFDIVPGAVTVGGDDADQNPWMIDYARLLPLAIAEIKSLRQRVAALGG
jgi:hypothetical protein